MVIDKLLLLVIKSAPSEILTLFSGQICRNDMLKSGVIIMLIRTV